MFGLDSLTGAIVWQYLLPGMKPFQRKNVASGDVDIQFAIRCLSNVQRLISLTSQSALSSELIQSDAHLLPVLLFFLHFKSVLITVKFSEILLNVYIDTKLTCKINHVFVLICLKYLE